MTEFVLVHSPLVGPGTWSAVAGVLDERGHRTVIPSLVDTIRDGEPTWATQAAAVAARVEEAKLTSPVLCGHSGAGPLLPAIGRALAAQAPAAAYVFVDAALPSPGGSRLASLHPALRARLDALESDGMLPPWHEWWDKGAVERLLPDPVTREAFLAELSPVSARLLEETIPVVEGWPDAPCAYLRLSEPYDVEEADAAGQGWVVASRPGSHLDLLVRPDAVAEAILALLPRLGLDAG